MQSRLALAFFLSSLTTSAAVAAPSICETFRAATEEQLTVVKDVQAYGSELTKAELGLVQTTIQIGNPTQQLSAADALKEFSDAGHEGSNGGSLVFSKMAYGTHIATIVQVAYYPGDNQHGALFTFSAGPNGNGNDSADLIGLIQDGDISCLAYD